MVNRKGLLYAILAYAGWGFLPMYWKAFQQLSAFEVLAHRIVWSAIFVWLLVVVWRRAGECLRAVRDLKRLGWMALGATFVTVNWLTYIYSVNSGHIVEASLGYYINPLVNVLLGMFFLHERLSKFRYIALGLAAAGVAVMIVSYGKFPWMAITLAISFGLYGLVKKKVSAEAMVSLTWETTIVFPIAVAYLVLLQAHGAAHAFALPTGRLILLLLSGVATAIPLLWFGMAARQLDMATLGFIQYLSPTISLVLGIFVYHETFTLTDVIAFGFIWVALIVYSATLMGSRKAGRRIVPDKLMNSAEQVEL